MQEGFEKCNIELAECIADKEINDDDIYNFDETTVYYENPPSKVWVPK